jgi:hypothetical protein
MEVAESLPENAPRLDFAAAQFEPSAELTHDRRALENASLEALLLLSPRRFDSASTWKTLA